MPRYVIDPDTGTIHYRTRLMDAARANAFAACLNANPDFSDASVRQFRSRYFVAYAPKSASRRRAMVDIHTRARQQRAAREHAGYKWTLEARFIGRRPVTWYLCRTPQGVTYEVTATSCTCRDFEYRSGPLQISCKHIAAYQLAASQGEIKDLEEVRKAIAQALGQEGTTPERQAQAA
jgi:hypothetical protein